MIELTLSEKQEIAWNLLEDPQIVELDYGGAAGGGKAACLSTPILTQNGWRTIDSLKVGDYVFDETGKPTKVLAKSQLFHDPTYKVSFTDGEEIVVNESHVWNVITPRLRDNYARTSPEFLAKRRAKRSSRSIGKRPDNITRNSLIAAEKREAYIRPSVWDYTESITTKNLVSLIKRETKKVAVPVGEGIEGTIKWQSDVPPFTLGAWIGDGYSHHGTIVTPKKDIKHMQRRLEGDGWLASIRERHKEGKEALCLSTCRNRQDVALRTMLREEGYLNNKHVPSWIINTSIEDRVNFLCGLLDTDGHVDKQGSIQVCMADKEIVNEMHRICWSLGLAATSVKEKETTSQDINFSGKAWRFDISQCRLPIVSLERKAARFKKINREYKKYRYISSIERVPVVPTQCIQVDNPRGLYRIGNTSAVTHNSLLFCLWMTLRCRRYPGIREGLGRKELKRLKETTVVTLLREAFPILGVKQNDYLYKSLEGIIKFRNGSEIILVDLARQPSDPDFDSLGSLNLTDVIIEEAGEIVKKAKDVFSSRKNRWMNNEYNLVGKTVLGQNPSQNFTRVEYYEPYKKLGMGDTQKWEVGQVEVNGIMLPAYKAFVKALPTDNPFLSRNYIEVLNSLPSQERKRLRDGNWDYMDDSDGLFGSLLIDRAIIGELSTHEKPLKFIGVDVADKGKDKTIVTLIEDGIAVEQKRLMVDVSGEKAISELYALELIKFAQQRGFDASDAKRIAIEGNGVGVGCLPPKEKVMTDSGLKRIIDISLSDKLIGSKGDFVKILNKQIYNVDKIDTYKIKISNIYRTTTFTDEHPLFASSSELITDLKTKKLKWDHKFGFKPVRELKEQDWLRIPNIYKKEKSVPDFSNYDIPYWTNTKQRIMLKDIFRDKDFWWLIGYWLGDGWLQKNMAKGAIHFCFNKKQPFYMRKIQAISNRLFNRKATCYKKPTVDNCKIQCNPLYDFLLDNFGQYSYGKKMPEWVKYIKNEYKYNLIAGYLASDGCVHEVREARNNKQYIKISFSSINLSLLDSIQDILFSLGIVSSNSLKRRAGRSIIKNHRVSHTKKMYSLSIGQDSSIRLLKKIYESHNPKTDIDLKKFIQKRKNRMSNCYLDGEYIYLRVMKIKADQYSGKVYNFECYKNAFMCQGVLTHNCRDFMRSKGWFITVYEATARSRSQGYFDASQSMDGTKLRLYSQLETLGELRKQLSVLTYEFDENLLPVVLNKKKVKEMLGYSPDEADSFMIAHWIMKGGGDVAKDSDLISW